MVHLWALGALRVEQIRHEVLRHADVGRFIKHTVAAEDRDGCLGGHVIEENHFASRLRWSLKVLVQTMLRAVALATFSGHVG